MPVAKTHRRVTLVARMEEALRFSLPFSHLHSHSHSLSLTLFLSLSFSHSLSLPLFLSLPFSHSLSLTPFLSLSFSHSLSLTLFLSPFSSSIILFHSLNCRVKRVLPTSSLPTRATPHSAGYDLYSAASLSVPPRGKVSTLFPFLRSHMLVYSLSF